MVLADTSVLINYFKGRTDAKTELFGKILSHNVPFGISGYSYQELLQSAESEKEFKQLKEYLSSQQIYFLPGTVDIHEQAARMYFDLRRGGVTVRSMIDVLIALTAIWNNLYLLHSDGDFDIMAEKLPKLNILKSL